ncbi:MAG: N-acetyl-gamma-glutamyl-phosphate reductase [Leptospiraceae bacterium]|nr:N-acetyl-gamma-glutamyl-phosphate reductase [Leptospiraceae bacterium]
MKELAIIGAGGYTGRELIRLLNNHSEFQLLHITSNQLVGKSYQESFPQDKYRNEIYFQNHESEIPSNATVVLATPNETSMELVPRLLEKGHRVIDLSGSYRLHDRDIFEKNYKIKHTHFDYMKKAVFGLPEFYASQIRDSEFVSNPGCFATSSIIPIRILRSMQDKFKSSIVIDSKTGVSGAGGRTEEVGFLFTNTYENFRSYKVLGHQHEPEIAEYSLDPDLLASGRLEIVFTPHLLPVYRGILSTIYIQTDPTTASKIPDLLKAFCKEHAFLRYKENPEEIELKFVQNTNYLDISAKVRNGTVVIVTALDNLVKGAAGQALQNLNIMHSLPETMGLI